MQLAYTLIRQIRVTETNYATAIYDKQINFSENCIYLFDNASEYSIILSKTENI